jgi:hypothetical protein
MDEVKEALSRIMRENEKMKYESEVNERKMEEMREEREERAKRHLQEIENLKLSH